jgi:serine/threonine protein kinase
LKELGKGSFGKVYLATLHEDDSEDLRAYALKGCQKSEIIRMKQVQHIKNEKAILEEISHPFIIELLSTF